MKYIYREKHTVYVDYELTISDDELTDKGINPYDDFEISEYIKENYDDHCGCIYENGIKQLESTEWWISAQNGNFERVVGVRQSEDKSESSIKWLE